MLPEGQQGFARPLEVSDFSGGKTDNFIDGQINQQKENDNLLITENKKLIQRPGSLIFDADNAQTPSGNNRIAEFITTDDTLFSQVGRELHYIDGTFQTLTGPTGNSVFTAGDANSKIAWSEWNKHYILTNSDFSDPMKVFRDENGDYRALQAGLPAIDLESAIVLANSLRTNYNAHVNDISGAGSDHISIQTAALVTAAAATDFETLITLVNDLVAKYELHDGDAELVTPTFHIAQEASDHSLASLNEVFTLSEAIVVLDDFKAKFNAHDADTNAHTNGSIHQEALFSVPQASATANGNAYIYTIVYANRYKVDTVAYLDIGPTFQIQLTDIESPDIASVTITQIPTLTNSADKNYDTANTVVQIYRTAANGATSTLLVELTNGTSSYVDSAADSTITNNAPLYTDGGILDNNPPPKSKYNVTVNNSTWYGHVKIGSEIHTSRLYQSIAFDPDSVPASAFIDIEDEIVGLGAINIYPIVFCKNHIYRIEGGLDEFGDGVLVKREISRATGGLNHLSIVDAREGLFFAGTDGFYFTDGFNIKKLTDELDESFREIIDTDAQKERIIGQYDRINDLIYWGISSTSAVPDNDKFWVLDLKWGMRDNSTITTVSNRASWSPSSIGITPDNKTLVIGDRRGYLFKFDSLTRTDPKVELGVAVNLWQVDPVFYEFEWIKTKFDESYRRKFVPEITVTIENITNLSLEIQSENDNSRNFIPISEIRFRDNITWGDDTIIWNDPDDPPTTKFLWNTFPLISARRRFPGSQHRCTYKSIKMVNSLTILRNSDEFGTATVDNTMKTVTLTQAMSTWPEDVVDQFITFEADNYTQLFLVTTRDSDTVITYQDDGDNSPDGTLIKWELKGYPKGEVFDLANFSIVWLPATATHKPYRANESGGNS